VVAVVVRWMKMGYHRKVSDRFYTLFLVGYI